jgi:hypothetical protein
VKNIDFLPDIYRQRTAMRQARIWWGVVVLIFGTAIGSTAFVQYLVRRSVQQQLLSLEPEFFAAQEKVQRLAQLQSQSRTAGETAALVTYLESTWPKTQLLALVVAPAPPSIRMTAVNIVEEELQRPQVEQAGPRRRAKNNAPEEEANLSPPLRDLEKLRQEHDYRIGVIEIIGEVTDTTELHDYVAQLGAQPLVDQAQIKSLESAPADAKSRTTQFTLRVRVRPNYCQPGGTPEPKRPGTQAQRASGLGPMASPTGPARDRSGGRR